MSVVFAESYQDIQKVVAAAKRAGDRGEAIGFDTEFYGVDIGKESTYTKAKIHMFSVAVQRFPTQITARGLPICDAAVLLASGLNDRGMVELLEAAQPAKAVHNLPVDAHALANQGIRLGGGINTLALARWAWPERARGRGFTLDALGQDFLGQGKIEQYDDIFTEEYEALRSTFRSIRVCECGARPCRRRQSVPGHTRISEQVETVHSSIKNRPVPLESVVPGHVLWSRAVEYAARDAVMALQVYNLALCQMNETPRDVPWAVG